MAIESEIMLAGYVVDWLQSQHWDVYQEVRPGWRGDAADIVAVRQPLLWTIECKRSLSLAVIAQAHRWPTLQRSIAVPCPARRRKRDQQREFAFEVCERFQIGVIEVGRTGEVYEAIKAPILRQFRGSSKRTIQRLHPDQRTFLAAGSRSGGRWTPYWQTMNAVRNIIGEYPGCTLAFIMRELDTHHFSTDAAARSSIARSLVEWSDWCFVDESVQPRRYLLAGALETEAAERMLYQDVEIEVLTIEDQEAQSKEAPCER